MRIRSTKPEFWRSERIASVDWDSRLVLKGLESYVDDNGVGKDDLALIVSDVFPRDLAREPSRTLARVTAALDDLAAAGLLWRYEADGHQLLFVSFWEDVQRIDRPTAGRFPRPDGTINYKDSIIRESNTNPREDSRALASGTGEQGNRGTGEQNTPSPAEPARTREPNRFDEFWKYYPRKVGKDEARRAYDSARKRVHQQTLIDGAAILAADPNLPEQRFIPHPATWLRRGGWDDEPLPPRRSGPAPTDDRVRGHLALAERLAAQEAEQDRMELTR